MNSYYLNIFRPGNPAATWADAEGSSAADAVERYVKSWDGRGYTIRDYDGAVFIAQPLGPGGTPTSSAIAVKVSVGGVTVKPNVVLA